MSNKQTNNLLSFPVHHYYYHKWQCASESFSETSIMLQSRRHPQDVFVLCARGLGSFSEPAPQLLRHPTLFLMNQTLMKSCLTVVKIHNLSPAVPFVGEWKDTHSVSIFRYTPQFHLGWLLSRSSHSWWNLLLFYSPTVSEWRNKFKKKCKAKQNETPKF